MFKSTSQLDHYVTQKHIFSFDKKYFDAFLEIQIGTHKARSLSKTGCLMSLGLHPVGMLTTNEPSTIQ